MFIFRKTYKNIKKSNKTCYCNDESLWKFCRCSNNREYEITKDAAAIYIEQGRADLADDEMAQTKILDQFLPQQMSAEELENAVANIIVKVGAKGPADMGKVMGVTSKELAGKAEGRAIADTVKALLNK